MDDLKNKELRRFARFFLFNFLLCVVAYLLLISNELANTYDGLWNGAEYRNYSWVVEIGRWFWPVVGKAQMNVCPEPFTSVLALCFYVLGSCMAAFWFGLKDSFHGYLLVLAAVAVWAGQSAEAAPFAKWFSHTLADGRTVRIWGEGDEYSASFEAADGHAALYDDSRRCYVYAAKDEATGALTSVGIVVEV